MNLTRVSKQSFLDFVGNNNLTIVAGNTTHQTLLVDSNGKIVASQTTSSYGDNQDEYRIIEGKEPHCNIETMQIVASIMQ